MPSHREVLRQLLDAHGVKDVEVAKLMGWRSPQTLAHKLAGRRGWKSPQELERLAGIAGITLVQLSEMSNDLHLTETKEALHAADAVDRMDSHQRARVMAFIRAVEAEKTNK